HARNARRALSGSPPATPVSANQQELARRNGPTKPGSPHAPRRTTMKTKPLIGLLALAAVGLAACGSGGSNASSAPTAAPAPAAAAGPVSTISVKVADNKIGKILIAADGHTLYGFTNDADAKSTCYSACANAWPPVIVDPQWSVGPGLDMGVFS